MPLVIYTLYRLLLLVAAFGLAYLVGLRGWLLVLVAVVVAFAVSYLALVTPRDAATAWLARRSERRAERRGAERETTDRIAAEDAAAEDAAFDGPQSDRPSPSSTP